MVCGKGIATAFLILVVGASLTIRLAILSTYRTQYFIMTSISSIPPKDLIDTMASLALRPDGYPIGLISDPLLKPIDVLALLEEDGFSVFLDVESRLYWEGLNLPSKDIDSWIQIISNFKQEVMASTTANLYSRWYDWYQLSVQSVGQASTFGLVLTAYFNPDMAYSKFEYSISDGQKLASVVWAVLSTFEADPDIIYAFSVATAKLVEEADCSKAATPEQNFRYDMWMAFREGILSTRTIITNISSFVEMVSAFCRQHYISQGFFAPLIAILSKASVELHKFAEYVGGHLIAISIAFLKTSLLKFKSICNCSWVFLMYLGLMPVNTLSLFGRFLWVLLMPGSDQPTKWPIRCQS